jgi:hypothetical protein
MIQLGKAESPALFLGMTPGILVFGLALNRRLAVTSPQEEATTNLGPAINTGIRSAGRWKHGNKMRLSEAHRRRRDGGGKLFCRSRKIARAIRARRSRMEHRASVDPWQAVRDAGYKGF